MILSRRFFLATLTLLVSSLGFVVPAQSAVAAGPVTQIAVWGDSMTQVWPDYLQDLVGVRVLNMGVGGDTVQETQALFDAWVRNNPGEVATTGHLCWCGHPNTNRKSEDHRTVVPTLQAMAAEVPRGLFMPIGLTNGPDQGSGTLAYQEAVVDVNGDMSRAFRAMYAEVRRFLVTDGLDVAGITPTQEDRNNIAIDVPPASLRTDGPGNPAHLNDAGRRVTAIRLNDLVRAAGWVRTDTRTPTEVDVAASANPVTSGTLVRFTATVSAGASGVPTGTVQFEVYGRKIGGPVPLVNGVATSVPAKATLTGDHPIEANYFGDATFAPGTGLIVLHVDRAPGTANSTPAGPGVFTL
ncbi:MAG: Ig-like domain repeat protein [Geodermatophilaceae bacterium]|nr:Ig-like domain repeat protein [Geodermatophilaceae bacterium]